VGYRSDQIPERVPAGSPPRGLPLAGALATRMTRTPGQVRRYRSRFGWAFLVSVTILFVSSLAWFALPGPSAPPHAPPPVSASRDSISLAMLISVASLLTSLASLGGFCFTTAVAWRRERREQQHADVELERKKLEVEKLRIELGQARSQPPPTSGQSGDGA
jgi:hypothetical protein